MQLERYLTLQLLSAVCLKVLTLGSSPLLVKVQLLLVAQRVVTLRWCRQERGRAWPTGIMGRVRAASRHHRRASSWSRDLKT